MTSGRVRIGSLVRKRTNHTILIIQNRSLRSHLISVRAIGRVVMDDGALTQVPYASKPSRLFFISVLVLSGLLLVYSLFAVHWIHPRLQTFGFDPSDEIGQ